MTNLSVRRSCNIVIDFSHLGDFCGFGNIADHFAPLLAQAEVPDLHFVYMVPERFKGRFGEGVDYVAKEHPRRDLKRLRLPIHLWHATDQQFRYRYCGRNTLQLLTVHDVNFIYEKSGLHRLRHILQLKHRLKHSDQITVISHFTGSELARHIGLQGRPMQVIHNAVEGFGEAQGRRPAFVPDDDVPFFFAVGQIRQKKNFQTLVPMMKRLPGYRLFICGDDHFDYAEQLRAIIRSDGDNRVFLPGKISHDELVWLYRHCRAYFFPGSMEGFGIPAIEAMLSGCPLFASRLGSLPEVCDRYATYWDSLDADAMADVVQSRLQSDDAALLSEARVYAQSFSYERYVSEYIALYRWMLGLG